MMWEAISQHRKNNKTKQNKNIQYQTHTLKTQHVQNITFTHFCTKRYISHMFIKTELIIELIIRTLNQNFRKTIYRYIGYWCPFLVTHVAFVIVKHMLYMSRDLVKFFFLVLFLFCPNQAKETQQRFSKMKVFLPVSTYFLENRQRGSSFLTKLWQTSCMRNLSNCQNLYTQYIHMYIYFLAKQWKKFWLSGYFHSLNSFDSVYSLPSLHYMGASSSASLDHR
eukprot:TRINITY_DN4197_c0_g1_i18.p1 TRINITY_DN4197_c0_g1~~TRINITY_DN4197_c0_g1_i18.p1  ORF type:complete len:223 (+),score=-15.38 TRINITY_DN4197_c0_g1_i18:105-773(+)